MNDEIMKAFFLKTEKIAKSTNNNLKNCTRCLGQSKKENYDILGLEWKIQIIFR